MRRTEGGGLCEYVARIVGAATAAKRASKGFQCAAAGRAAAMRDALTAAAGNEPTSTWQQTGVLVDSPVWQQRCGPGLPATADRTVEQ